MIRIAIIATLLACTLSACSDEPKQDNTSKPTAASQPTQKIAQIKAQSVIDAIQSSKLPITNITPKTAETDPNKLLGRPHQYVEKIDFKDSRVKDAEVYVETFSNLEDLDARYQYVDEIAKKMPMVAQYQIKHKNVLVRLEKAFTPTQVAEYEKAISGL